MVLRKAMASHLLDLVDRVVILIIKIQGTEEDQVSQEEGMAVVKMTKGIKSSHHNNRMSTEDSRTKTAKWSVGIGQIRKTQKIASILCWLNWSIDKMSSNKTLMLSRISVT